MNWGVQWVRVICPLWRCACAALHRLCFDRQGNSGSQLLSPAGMMCEMCGFLCLWLLFPFSPLPLLFFSRHTIAEWWLVGGWRWGMGGEGDHWAVSVHDAHSLFSLPLWLPVGLKRSIVLTGSENIFPFFFLRKRGGGARGCLGQSELQWRECLDVKKEVGWMLGHFNRLLRALFEF